MTLDGKIALVTGGSRGIGRAIVQRLTRRGAQVYFTCRTAPHTTGATGIQTDHQDAGSVEQMFAVIGDRLDILVNNAAITFVGDLYVPMRRHDLMMEVNLRAPLLAIRDAAPVMAERGGGSIVNVSSAAALFPFPDTMSYGMSKVALERLTVDAARQLQAQQIAVNCFRIDIAVASEGFLANTPGADHSTWEPPEVAAEGILWMIRQPVTYSGRRESMYALREREGIMASRAQRQVPPELPPLELFDGLAMPRESMFREPYD
jgi:citronellol/citronellal dehydrogenase